MEAQTKLRAKVNLNPVSYKTVKDAKFDEKSNTVSGYLAIFGNVDDDGDLIIKGAFAESIAQRGPNSNANRKIAFLWQHDMTDPIGKMTVLREDDIGLYFEALLDVDGSVPNADRAKQQLLSGTLNQFSIGFQYDWENMEYDDNLDAFICKKLTLFEGSVVTLGANGATFFDGMKSGKDAKIQLIKETDKFIKCLPANFQYTCRQLISKNLELQKMRTKEKAPDPEGEENPDYDDMDYIHDAMALHAKAMKMINDHMDDVKSDELKKCMKSMDEMHTKCMSDLVGIKSELMEEDDKGFGQNPLSRKNSRFDLSKALKETKFFN